MLPARSLPAGAGLFLVTILMGCASAGPDLNGPDGPTLIAAYSGDWVLVPEESEDLNRKVFNSIEDAVSGRGGGGRPGGGGGSGRRGGTDDRGGMRGGMDPEEMRRSMEVIGGMAEVPGELFLILRPEAVTLIEGAGNALVLTFGVTGEEIQRGGVTLLTTAKWAEKGIEIRRELRQGGAVIDQISLNENGDIVLEREIDLLGQRVAGTLVYQRKSDEG